MRYEQGWFEELQPHQPHWFYGILRGVEGDFYWKECTICGERIVLQAWGEG